MQVGIETGGLLVFSLVVSRKHPQRIQRLPEIHRNRLLVGRKRVNPELVSKGKCNVRFTPPIRRLAVPEKLGWSLSNEKTAVSAFSGSDSG
jgi:hypothetical protein